MPLEGEYEPSPNSWVREQVELYEGSNGSEGTTMRGVPVIIVTTRGVKSGKLRKVPLIRVEHEGVYLAVASKGGAPQHPTWYFNLVADPHVEVRDGATVRDARARELTGEERAAWWQRAVSVWPDYNEYQQKTDRVIPVFALEPVTD
jgi:deazaflavin-dependent oxidoreductase (nitroreductase family)